MNNEVKRMTVTKLREEAKKLGYKLVKNEPYVSLLPCSCGEKRKVYCVHGGEKIDGKLVFYRYYECKSCGLKGEKSKTERSAKIAWNQKVGG